MNIFLTGATGYVGGAVARALTAAGHHVTGLAHSADGARKLQAARVFPHSGSLQDADSLAEGARGADAVIHAALDATAEAPHQVDIQATSTLLRALAGTSKTLVYTSGLTVLGDTGGVVADEDTRPTRYPSAPGVPRSNARSWRPPGTRSAPSSSVQAGPTGTAAERSGCSSKTPSRTASPSPSATAETTGPSCISTTSPAFMCWLPSNHPAALCCTPSGHRLPRSLMSPPQPPERPEAKGASAYCRWRRPVGSWACAPTL